MTDKFWVHQGFRASASKGKIPLMEDKREKKFVTTRGVWDYVAEQMLLVAPRNLTARVLIRSERHVEPKVWERIVAAVAGLQQDCEALWEQRPCLPVSKLSHNSNACSRNGHNTRDSGPACCPSVEGQSKGVCFWQEKTE
ncbi:MAG: hypothetical protein V1899_06460 [Planctomycetota bacterium]